MIFSNNKSRLQIHFVFFTFGLPWEVTEFKWFESHPLVHAKSNNLLEIAKWLCCFFITGSKDLFKPSICSRIFYYNLSHPSLTRLQRKALSIPLHIRINLNNFQCSEWVLPGVKILNYTFINSLMCSFRLFLHFDAATLFLSLRSLRLSSSYETLCLLQFITRITAKRIRSSNENFHEDSISSPRILRRTFSENCKS